MSKLTAPTLEFVQMLRDAELFSPDEELHPAAAGIFLHSARGHVGAEPGRVDVLSATTAGPYMAAHCHVTVSGQIDDILLAKADVDVLLAAFAPLAKRPKGDPPHELLLETRPADRGLELVAVEAPSLLEGVGPEIVLQGRDHSEFPAARLAQNFDPAIAAGWDPATERPPAVQTLMSASTLQAFTKVATRRGEPIQWFRWHHNHVMHVQIGDRFVGVLTPISVPADMPVADAADVDLFLPQQPTGGRPLLATAVGILGLAE